MNILTLSPFAAAAAVSTICDHVIKQAHPSELQLDENACW